MKSEGPRYCHSYLKTIEDFTTSTSRHEVKSAEYFWEMFPLLYQPNVPTLLVWIGLLIHEMFACASHFCLLLHSEFRNVSDVSA